MESTWTIFLEEVFTSNGFSGAITSTQITMRFSILGNGSICLGMNYSVEWGKTKQIVNEYQIF